MRFEVKFLPAASSHCSPLSGNNPYNDRTYPK